MLGELVADGGTPSAGTPACSALERQGPYAVPHLDRHARRRGPRARHVRAPEPRAHRRRPRRPPILPLLHHSDPNVAQAAIEALGQLRTGEAVPALLKLLDSELWLQLAAINALGAIGAPEAVGPLMALVPDSVLAEPAVQALRSIAAPESLEPLLELLPVGDGARAEGPAAAGHRRGDRPAPRPGPVARGRRPRAGRVPAAHRLSRPAAADVVADDDSSDEESLQRAAATLIAAAGLEALEPALLARLSTQPETGWLEGLFRRFPAGLAARRTRLIADADPDVRSGALRAGPFEDDELPELFEHLEDPSAKVRAAACYAHGPARAGRGGAVPRRASPPRRAGRAGRGRPGARPAVGRRRWPSSRAASARTRPKRC